jgi:hypothetical protein
LYAIAGAEKVFDRITQLSFGGPDDVIESSGALPGRKQPTQLPQSKQRLRPREPKHRLEQLSRAGVARRRMLVLLLHGSASKVLLIHTGL